MGFKLLLTYDVTMEKHEKKWLNPWREWKPRWCPILYGASILFCLFFIVTKRSPFEVLFPHLWEKLLLTIADDHWLFLWVDYWGSQWYHMPLFAAVVVTLGRWLFKRFPSNSNWRSCASEMLMYSVGIFAVTYLAQVLVKWLY